MRFYYDLNSHVINICLKAGNGVFIRGYLCRQMKRGEMTREQKLHTELAGQGTNYRSVHMPRSRSPGDVTRVSHPQVASHPVALMEELNCTGYPFEGMKLGT